MWAMTKSTFLGANAAPASYYIRRRKIQKACYDAAITILCGFMTFTALRSCLEGGKLRTPMDDLHDIQRVSQAFAHVRKQLVISDPALDPAIDSGIATSEPNPLNSGNHSTNSHISKVVNQNSKPIGGPLLNPITIGHSDLTTQSHPSSLKLDSITHDQFSSTYGLLLVTASQPSPCLTSQDTRLLLLSLKNKLDYCRIHGIEMTYDVHVHTLTHPNASLLRKLSIIMDLMLSNSRAKWFWWVDNDALFTNMSTMLPMEKYNSAEYNMVILQGLDDQQRELQELEAGAESANIWGRKSFLLRNCAWSIDLISAYKDLDGNASSDWEGSKLGSSDVFDDLITKKSSKWSNKVHVETSSCLQVSRDGTQEAKMIKRGRITTRRAIMLGGRQWVGKSSVDESNYVGGRKWVGKSNDDESNIVDGERALVRPLLTHLVGCKLCAKTPITKPCTHHMEAALQAARDEALQVWGIHDQQHKGKPTSQEI